MGILVPCLAMIGCEVAYPEVVVTNAIAETVQVRHVSFNGCAWEGVLAFGEATAPGRCLPGSDRVHFEKLDAAAYCREQAGDGTLDGVCPCGPQTATPELDEGLLNVEPMWFSYQTTSAKTVRYGGFYHFELTPTGLEQDFSVPGPYGH